MLGGCRVFPTDNPWNRDISGDPVDANSANYIASINLGAPHLHADFGSPADYGIPYVVVPGTQPMVPITFNDIQYLRVPRVSTVNPTSNAGVAELADAPDSKSGAQ